MSKDDFISYYKSNLNLEDEDFSKLLQCLETKLRQSFRIIDSPFYSKIKNFIEKMSSVKKVDFLKDTFEIDKTIEENLTSYKKTLTSAASEKYKKLIINQTLIGSIQRQEIVSMIPIILAGINRDHYVLDLCAAPGSKTKQILNIVGESGLIVANDQNSKRLNILLTETFKIPHSSFIATQYDASLFPSINFSNNRKFNRVLCDVPCSSDATIRKNPGLLCDWTKKKAENLFDLQYRILKRSVDLVEDNGLIIYSTCSLNPLENECVIQNIVGIEDLEVIDPFTFIDENSPIRGFLKRRGLTNWNIKDYEHNYLRIDPIKKELGLDKCIRIYPHDFNTGGFFIALLRKRNQKQIEKTFKKAHFNPVYTEVLPEENLRILNNYGIQTNINLVRRFGANNVLYKVSDEVKHILFNNKLKVIYAGYKYFEKCNISETGFRIKNVLYDKDAFVDLEFKLEDLKKAIEEKVLYYEYSKKSVIIKITDLDVRISGWSTGKKIMLYVSNNLQKALLDFTN